MQKKKGNFIIMVLVILTLSLYLLSKADLKILWRYPWLSVSQMMSLVGAVLLSFNFVLGSRSKFLENWFGGLDEVNKKHQRLGKISYFLLLLHPLLLAVNVLPNVKAAINFLYLSQNNVYNFGVLALYLMTAVLFLTLVMKLPYHIWIVSHDFMGLVLLLGIFHVFLIDSDVSVFLPLRIWILGFLGIAMYFYIYKVFLYKWLGPKHEYLVKRVKKIGDILEIYLEPKSKSIAFLPGQFAYLSFDDPELKEAHPFSFSSSPDKKILRFSVKILGDYTAKLTGLKKGTNVRVWGAHGRMYQGFYANKEVVCIAGGIGITPFLSMLDYETNHKLKRKIHFFYITRSEKEAVYDKELKKIKSNLETFNYHRYFGENKPRITADIIEDKIGDLNKKLFYLCGPISMMTSISDQLYKKGVRKKDIIFENFNFK
ncbi:TPA: hypothetical protein DCQ19_01150 [Candidatus Shapirobacteria bacterium]|nr:hypothetical protein [Candidatus Shapirobacteria bacterium]